MEQFKVLVLTDHSGHTTENALYALAKAMYHHPRCAQMDVATVANPQNNHFFSGQLSKSIYASPVDESFQFSEDGRAYKRKLRRVLVRSYDVIWLRMPPPLSEKFVQFLKNEYPSILFVNDPKGIYDSGSKAFLMNFQEWCPPMRICSDWSAIANAAQEQSIILKPFRDYGGKGIIRIHNGRVEAGKESMNLEAFAVHYNNDPKPYLAVKFLKNVKQGDKRIIVVNGEIMGASLRMPPEGSWLCNVSQGGTSMGATVDDRERAIVAAVNPILQKMGIAMYGLDTLVGDDGRRVLSEINTTSIGGLPQIAEQLGKPRVKEAADLMWQFITQRLS